MDGNPALADLGAAALAPISELSKLVSFRASSCRLPEMQPGLLRKFTRLELLILNENAMVALPRELGCLTNLRALRIENNGDGGGLGGSERDCIRHTFV